MSLLLLLASCASVPRTPVAEPEPTPAATDWGPHKAGLEWWYVSGVDPEARVAFHFAMFKAPVPKGLRFGKVVLRNMFPGEFFAAHVATTDLATGERTFLERRDFPRGQGEAAFPPLSLRLDDWALEHHVDSGEYRIDAAPLRLVLEPEKPATVLLPGGFGDDALGRLAYESCTRLSCTGTVGGRPVHCLAWMDHQWGDLQPGETAVWDWVGVHLSDGSDVMAARLTKPDGSHVVLAGARTDREGRMFALTDLRMEPRWTWRSKTGRTYRVAWRLSSREVHLDVAAVRLEQEILSESTGIAYWEGAVEGAGTAGGTPVHASGMGESVVGLAGSRALMEAAATAAPSK